MRIDVNHQHGNRPLQLNATTYKSIETHTISRLAYLLSNFAVQRENGTWQNIPNQFAYIDHQKKRTQFWLKNIPENNYKSIRFSIGVPKKQNHADPNTYAPDHPLNPNLNQLHWNWTGGYIFLALEGKYHTPENQQKGFVYHLANDNNLTTIQLHKNFSLKQNTGLTITLDTQKLLTNPRPISFTKDGPSTHSHPGDTIASALIANLQTAFTLDKISYPKGETPQAHITPLHLP